MSIEQTVLEKLKTLPSDKQQEVLDFVEFLQTRFSLPQSQQAEKPSISALEAAGDLVGCVKGGPPDLSTNKQYMEGFGEV
jgi:hypothetical protein